MVVLQVMHSCETTISLGVSVNGSAYIWCVVRPSGQLQTCVVGVLRHRCEQPALSRAHALLAEAARSRNAFTPIMLASCSTTACRSRPSKHNGYR